MQIKTSHDLSEEDFVSIDEEVEDVDPPVNDKQQAEISTMEVDVDAIKQQLQEADKILESFISLSPTSINSQAATNSFSKPELTTATFTTAVTDNVKSAKESHSHTADQQTVTVVADGVPYQIPLKDAPKRKPTYLEVLVGKQTYVASTGVPYAGSYSKLQTTTASAPSHSFTSQDGELDGVDIVNALNKKKLDYRNVKETSDDHYAFAQTTKHHHQRSNTTPYCYAY